MVGKISFFVSRNKTRNCELCTRFKNILKDLEIVISSLLLFIVIVVMRMSSRKKTGILLTILGLVCNFSVPPDYHPFRPRRNNTLPVDGPMLIDAWTCINAWFGRAKITKQ
jgi:hypothetical protein